MVQCLWQLITWIQFYKGPQFPVYSLSSLQELCSAVQCSAVHIMICLLKFWLFSALTCYLLSMFNLHFTWLNLDTIHKKVGWIYKITIYLILSAFSTYITYSTYSTYIFSWSHCFCVIGFRFLRTWGYYSFSSFC